MKTTILFFAFLVTCVSTAQDFELIKPNKKDLRTKFQENSSLDIIYLYLSNNFTSITGKQNVKKIEKTTLNLVHLQKLLAILSNTHIFLVKKKKEV